MNRKIIIITSDSDSNYSDTNNPLGKKIVEGEGVPMFKKESCLAAFQHLSKYKATTIDKKTIYEISEIENKYDITIKEEIRNWLDGNIRNLKIPDDMDMLLDKVRDTLNEEKLYEKITMDNGDMVYLLYWNLLGEKEFNVWHCIPLICKDCEIDMNVTIQEIPDRHILYIHDDEWGKEGNRLLMKNSEPKEKGKEGILNKLKDISVH